MPRIDLLTVGEAFQDLIFVGLPHMPKSGEELRTQRFTATIGGGALITGTAAARLGLKTAVASALSVEAVRALRREHIRVLNVKRPSEAHAVTVSLSTTAERSFVTFDGVNDRLESRLAAVIARQRARHIHLAFAPRNCTRWTRIVAGLRAAGVTTSWDFGWNPALRAASGFHALVAAADFIFVNDAEATMYARTRQAASLARFWRRTSRNTIIKLGPRGSRWIAGGHDEARRLQPSDISAPAPRVPVVDTTGAGDAFNGGFLFAWLGGATPRECLRIGNVIGAQSTLAPGGVDALPRRVPIHPARPPRPGVTRRAQPTRP
ncbi:MAG: carbohydrate kinase family protein [Vicinamibacterales bacterium]